MDKTEHNDRDQREDEDATVRTGVQTRTWSANDGHSMNATRDFSLPFDHLLLGQLGRYELIREIGRGGYGVVYLANDPELQRRVAVKIARPEMVADEQGIKRFRQESRAAATLAHPGIIQVFDCGETNGLYYYVMPYLDCQNLAQWFEEQSAPLDETFAARLLLEIAEAISFGHSQGIIHRDLKPQNILLVPDASLPYGLRPIVLDFGLCGLLESDKSSTTLLAGTPRYMSPEQAMFGDRKVTEQSDIYSMGVILYQLLIGHPPHQPVSITEAVLMLHNAPVKSPRSLRPSLSAEIEAICLQCLRKDHERRYRSAEAFVDDLSRYLAKKPIAARPAGFWERMDFAIRFGDWEPRLGFAIIGINAVTFIWASGGAVVIAYQFPNDPGVIEGFTELLIFLTVFAFPLHAAGAFAGYLMLTRATYPLAFLASTIACGLWTIYLACVFFSDQPFLRIYENQGYTQSMVFLFIGFGFSLQTICLAVGAWAAYWRKKALAA